jgi:hypothetical protein
MSGFDESVLRAVQYVDAYIKVAKRLADDHHLIGEHTHSNFDGVMIALIAVAMAIEANG